MRNLRRLLCVIAAVGIGATSFADVPGPPIADPGEAGMNAERLARIGVAVEDALRAGRMPGCVVAIGRRGRIVHLKAYGHRQLDPVKRKMSTDTVFDLASLTKPIATATSVMLLIEQGKITLDDPVAKHIPEFGQRGKQAVTVHQLLTHQGGLIADNHLRDYRGNPAESFDRIFALSTVYEPGTKFVYSDVGFIVLGELVRSLSDSDLHEFSQKNIFRPLGMNDTGFLPNKELRPRRDHPKARWQVDAGDGTRSARPPAWRHRRTCRLVFDSRRPLPVCPNDARPGKL